MGRPFQITAASETVRLNSNGQGELVFTVSNASGGQLRGRGKLVHQDPASQAWVSLSAEQEQDFAAGATKQFPVKVKVPSPSKAGKYTFRLVVVSVQNPDEDYAEGPTVQFEVKQQAVPKKPFPWLILAVVGAALLIIVAVVLYLVLRNKPAKESTSGQPSQESASGQPAQASPSPPSAGQPGSPPPPQKNPLPYGPDTCKAGFVWRQIVPNDHVCVTPLVRTQALIDNSQAPFRRSRTGGAYGPDTCIPGFVWRQATPNDHVCVTGQTRTQTAEDNQAAASRRASP